MNAREETTMKQFINWYRIKIESEYVDSNPNMQDDGHRMNHYKVVLTARIDGKRKQFTTYFSMGLGLSGDPDAGSVLDCLASDSSGIDGQSFEDWAGDYGYDTDSRKAERTYNACVTQAAKLKKFLGESVYETLVYHTERL